MKKIYLFGNWKMNHGPKIAKYFTSMLGQILSENSSLTQETVFCLFPTALSVAAALEGLSEIPALKGKVFFGVQNVNDHLSGAFTGENSAEMAKELGCDYVILGHSERRHIFGETSEFVGIKVSLCLSLQLVPVLCVGETLTEREKGQTLVVIDEQLQKGLAGVKSPEQVIIAYEPVWAIGTGRAATSSDAEAVCRHIKEAVGEKTPVLYGGSVKISNAAELFSQPSIDGGLIGGASLKVDEYIGILKAFRSSENLPR